MGADALLRSRHQEQRRQPLGQRQLGTLEYGFDRDRELLAAFGALVEASAVGLALQRLDLGLIDVAAMGANRAIRPNQSLKPFAGFGLVLKDRVLQNGIHG